MNRISGRDIPFEQGKSDELYKMSAKFVDRFIEFVNIATPMLSQISGKSPEDIKNKSIFDIISTLMKIKAIDNPDRLSLSNSCKIKDVKGTERTIYFRINLSQKPGGEMGGLFTRHHAGGFTGALNETGNPVEDQEHAEMVGENFDIPNFQVQDKFISVDLSAQIPFNEFLKEKEEAVASIYGVLSHELSHAYDAKSKKENERYRGIQERMDNAAQQYSRSMMEIESGIGLLLGAVLQGKDPVEMQRTLKEEATKFKAQHTEFFKHYVNTSTEIKSSMKELKVFIDQLASGQFVEEFAGVRDRFKTMSNAERQSVIKKMLESLGSWNRIANFLTEKNRRMIFKFIYRLLTEPDRQTSVPASAPNGEEFEITRD